MKFNYKKEGEIYVWYVYDDENNLVGKIQKWAHSNYQIYFFDTELERYYEVSRVKDLKSAKSYKF